MVRLGYGQWGDWGVMVRLGYGQWGSPGGIIIIIIMEICKAPTLWLKCKRCSHTHTHTHTHKDNVV